MRILHIVFNLIRGGTEGQCARVAMALARTHTSEVAVFRREGFFLESVEEICGQVNQISISKVLSLQTARQIMALRKLVSKRAYDLVHCWDADAAIFGSIAARLAGIPYITSRRDLGDIYSRRKMALMNLADRGARAIVVNADAIRSRLVMRGVDRRRIVGIPNILDIREFDELSSKAFSGIGTIPGGKTVVMTARLDPEKDVESLLRAFAEVLPRHPDATLMIAGDGRERSKLEALSRALGLGERAAFLGEVNEVASLLNSASIGALVPISNEGLSNSILEYMAASLPVLATDCGGNRELVKDGETGFLVEKGDVRAMASSLDRLLADADLRASMGRAGRAIVEREHSPESVVRQFAELYKRVV